MVDSLVVTMYMDDDTMQKYFTGGAVGIDNRGFLGGVVPFAPQSDGEVTALKKFARAHRSKSVKGTPRYLLTIKIPAESALEHILSKEIKIMDGRPEPTIGFALPVNTRNFPSMEAQFVEIDVPGGPDQLLKSGKDLLSASRYYADSSDEGWDDLSG